MARKTGLKGLQEWAKHVTQGYRDVEITNMTTSFKSGLAFCAIIHRYRPELIPYDELKKENVFDNNKLVFSVAESELDIPALLDAEDMVALSVPDKLSIATYLVQYYNYFKDKEPAGKTSGVKVQARTEPAPSPKRTKFESAKSVSSPSLPLKSKENAPVSAPPRIPSPPLSPSQPPQNENSIRRGRKSKFNKPEATPTDGTQGTLKRGTMGSEQCEVCGKRVFLMERLGVENRVFHRACFKCCMCKVALKPSSYEHDAKSGKFYCQQHYRETMRERTIKRTMAERGLSPTDLDNTTPPLKPKRSKKLKNVSTGSKTSTSVTSESSSEPEHKTAVAKSSAQAQEPNNVTVMVAGREQSPPAVVKEDKRELTHSVEMKAGLPSLLKSLASSKQSKETAPTTTAVFNKRQQKDGTENMTMASSTHQKELIVTTSLPGTGEPTKPVRVSKTSQLELSTAKSSSGIPSKPPPPTTSIPVKPPPPYAGKSPGKSAEPVTSTFSEPVKSVEPVKVKETSKPVVSKSTPVKPAVSESTPVKPAVSESTRVKHALSKSTPVKPAAVSESTPVKPPRHKKTTPPDSAQSPEIPTKRGSIKPKRPAPPRPSQPPSMKKVSGQHHTMGAGTMDLQVLTEKRKRRVIVLKRQLEDVEREQERMEQCGVQLEQQLRQNGDEAEDHLIEEWFALVNDKNMLLRQESDLVYELRDLELIDQHEALDSEIRRRLAKDDSLKTEVERLEEEAMISELVELVEKRDKLLWTLHVEKTLDEEEDRQVELIASTQVHPKLVQRNKSLSFM